MKYLLSNVNLMKLPCAAVMSAGGEDCLILPLSRNDLFVKRNDEGKVTMVSLDLVQWETHESRYGDSHYIKQSHSKEWTAKNGTQTTPIIGNTKPMEKKEPVPAPAPVAPVDDADVPTWEELERMSRELQGIK